MQYKYENLMANGLILPAENRRWELDVRVNIFGVKYNGTSRFINRPYYSFYTTIEIPPVSNIHLLFDSVKPPHFLKCWVKLVPRAPSYGLYGG